MIIVEIGEKHCLSTNFLVDLCVYPARRVLRNPKDASRATPYRVQATRGLPLKFLENPRIVNKSQPSPFFDIKIKTGQVAETWPVILSNQMIRV